jgi:hypothetical protein
VPFNGNFSLSINLALFKFCFFINLAGWHCGFIVDFRKSLQEECSKHGDYCGTDTGFECFVDVICK